MEGAFEGIMSIIDNPKTHGLRSFCSKLVEAPSEFIHQEEMDKQYLNLDSKSIKESKYVDSCIPSHQDSIQGLAMSQTNDLICDL